MSVEPPVNPYLPPGMDDAALAPFAGRKTAFAALHQRLTDTIQPGALLFLGREYSGKTALLRRFPAFFDNAYIGVYLSLGETRLDNEGDWLRALVGAMTRALIDREYTLSRLPDPPQQDNLLREWLLKTYLPDLFSIIRRHRLVLLLDDADYLLDAVSGRRLPEDTFAFLHALLTSQSNLGMAFTLDSRWESQIGKFNPLVKTDMVSWLTRLAPDESAWLIQNPPNGYYIVSDESAVAIHKAAGGQPHLLQRFGFHLFQGWLNHPEVRTITPATVKTYLPRIYTESEADFRKEWDALSVNERRTLTAISQLLYADPLQTIQAAEVETWLAESDYPLDTTAINAAVRGLEYREIIELAASGLTLTAGMWQTWLLEHAHPDARPMASAAAPAARSANRRGMMILAAAVVVILVIVLVLASSGAGAAPETPAVPTVTLASGG